MRIGVIRNPNAGRGKRAREWNTLERRLNEVTSAEVVVQATTHAGHATQIAKQYVADAKDIVVAVGGDGTVHETLQPLVGTSTALAVLPLGTGNDFARTLGIGTSIDAAISAIGQGNIQLIDVGKWSQSDREGYFVNVAGTGFDAEVARRINAGIKGLTGTAAYLAGILQTLGSYKPTELELVVDGETIQRRALLCAYANARYYGGGMPIAPSADLCDGQLDLVLIGAMNRLEFVCNFPKLLRGTHLSHPRVEHRRFQSLSVRSIPPVPSLIDGELLGSEPLNIDVLPGALRVVTP